LLVFGKTKLSFSAKFGQLSFIFGKAAAACKSREKDLFLAAEISAKDSVIGETDTILEGPEITLGKQKATFQVLIFHSLISTFSRWLPIKFCFCCFT